MNLEKVDWILECPCKNDKISLDVKKIKIDVSNIITREDPVGAFYYSFEGGIFENLYFSENTNYNGSFILNSPLKLFWEITSKCNLSCLGCYIPSKFHKEISFEKMKMLVDDMADNKVIGVQLLGGEPTIFPYLKELIEYLYIKGIKIEIVTNGMHINKSLLDSIIKYVHKIFISIDGSESIHNKLRQNNNSFENAVKLNKTMLDNKKNVSIISTINKLNYLDVPYLLENFKNILFKFIIKSNLMEDSKKYLFLSGYEIKMIDSMFKKYSYNPTGTKLSFGETVNCSFTGCLGGITTGVIDVNGNIYDCIYKRTEESLMGNVYKDSISNIWLNHNNTSLLDEKCKKCANSKRCGGFCRL